jgi:hypothetical protein
LSYTIDLEEESKSNINFNVAQSFDSKNLLNELEYVKNLKIISDVSPEDIQFNWPFVIAIIVAVIGSLLLYIPLGFCWYYLHKNRFEKSENQQTKIYFDNDSKEENNRMRMIELQALNKDSETPIHQRNMESPAPSDKLENSNQNQNVDQYDLNEKMIQSELS